MTVDSLDMIIIFDALAVDERTIRIQTIVLIILREKHSNNNFYDTMATPPLGPSSSEGEIAAATSQRPLSSPPQQNVSSRLKKDALPTSEEKKDDNPVKDPDNYWYMPEPIIKAPKGAQHGKGGVFYAGNWLDIEDCDKVFNISEKDCSGCSSNGPCPRSRSRPQPDKKADNDNVYDVLIIGAGCIGAAIARELSKYNLSTLWVEAADDVSQGATKGNSGIVHAGYDDTPGTNHAKFCWPGNQMFAQLDKELRFGYQKNGSLVVAFNDQDIQHLYELKKRGEANGVQRLRIVHQAELKKMEPHINPNAIAALYSPDAGNVIPYVRSSVACDCWLEAVFIFLLIGLLNSLRVRFIFFSRSLPLPWLKMPSITVLN